MNEPPHNATGQPPTVLVNAIRKLLRPLVRLMLSHQITYPYLVSMLKSIYVEVADDDFKVAAKRQSDSRINLLTGVHRKDVKRLRAESGQPINTPKTVSIGAQLIAYWTGSEQFTDADGKPLPLPLRGANRSDPAKPTFDDLVELVCRQDIRPRVILDEWQNMGIAQLGHGGVVLNTGAFTPDESFDEKAFFFGKNIHDHLSASTFNLLGHKPSYFDRSVYYDNLTLESVQQLSKIANDEGMNALTVVNKAALALQKQDESRPDRSYRINFGVFNYNAAHPSESIGNEAKIKGDNDA